MHFDVHARDSLFLAVLGGRGGLCAATSGDVHALLTFKGGTLIRIPHEDAVSSVCRFSYITWRDRTSPELFPRCFRRTTRRVPLGRVFFADQDKAHSLNHSQLSLQDPHWIFHTLRALCANAVGAVSRNASDATKGAIA